MAVVLAVLEVVVEAVVLAEVVVLGEEVTVVGAATSSHQMTL